MTVLVAGGTGQTGRLCVARLRQLGVVVRVLTRDPSKARELHGATLIAGDALSADACRRAVEGCDAVLCTLGERRVPRARPIVDGPGIIGLIDAARTTGAGRFVLVSSLGVGDSWPWMPLAAKWFFRLARLTPILDAKARSEEHLRSSSLQWTILRPGGLHHRGMTVEPLLLTPDGRAPGISARQAVADVAVRCLQSRNAIGRVLTVLDGGMIRRLRQGQPFPLDVPWRPWSELPG